jgi:hypothetical protein
MFFHSIEAALNVSGFALKNILILKKFVFIKNAAVSQIYRIL